MTLPVAPRKTKLTELQEYRGMDDEGAMKLIAVIHRLANRIDSLDKITVEAAAIASEGRQAAMDAADATSPKQTAKHLATHIKPVIGKFDDEFRASMDHMKDIVGQLLVVAEEPEPKALRCFRASGRQGVQYAKGVWHHPLLVLIPEQDFLIVDRDGPGDNLIEITLPKPLTISL